MKIIIVYFIVLYKRTTQTMLTNPYRVSPIRYVDRLDNKDLFFDRIVAITLDVKNFTGLGMLSKVISLGVFISEDQVLTTYNPIRNLTTSAEMLDRVHICFLEKRIVKTGHALFYSYKCGLIKCGRPVIPMMDDELLDEQWHGPDKKHSPLHDLMVLQLETSVQFWKPIKQYTLEERHPPDVIAKGTSITAGPLLTILANATEKMTHNIRFCSVGLIGEVQSQKFFRLDVVRYSHSRHVIVDCDDWLPRYWGYFFCLWNDDELYAGFASGAMLFSEEKLFGVGSFTMWRGKDSILVFTDIRPYIENIFTVCSEVDLQRR